MNHKQRIIRPMEVSEGMILSTIKERAEKIPGFFFVQIGGFDGVTDDPIYEMATKLNWSGIIVEPQKEAFEKLVSNYKNYPKCTLKNIAITARSEHQTFYSVFDPHNKLPHWTKQISSLHRDVILKHREWIPDIEKYIVEEKISCTTIEDLLSKHNIQKINLLCIDTEGSDFEILSSLNFKKHKPELILFEHKHLTPAIRKQAFDFLQDTGYLLMHLPTDSLAYIPS